MKLARPALCRHISGLGRAERAAAAVGYLRATIVNEARSAQRRHGIVRRHLRVVEPDDGPGADADLLLAEDTSNSNWVIWMSTPSMRKPTRVGTVTTAAGSAMPDLALAGPYLLGWPNGDPKVMTLDTRTGATTELTIPVSGAIPAGGGYVVLEPTDYNGLGPRLSLVKVANLPELHC